MLDAGWKGGGGKFCMVGLPLSLEPPGELPGVGGVRAGDRLPVGLLGFMSVLISRPPSPPLDGDPLDELDFPDTDFMDLGRLFLVWMPSLRMARGRLTPWSL